MSTGIEAKLYELSGALEAVAERLLENGGELTPEMEQELAALDAAFTVKAERVALMVRRLTVQSEAAADEAHRLQALADVRLTAAVRLKDYLKREMERVDHRLIETPLVRLSVTNNPRPSIRWTREPASIPEAWRKVTYALDGHAAYLAYQTRGVLPDGFEVTLGTHLRMR